MKRALLVSLLVLLVAPAAAGAATVGVTGDCYRYGNCDYTVVVHAAPGERNAITVTDTNAPHDGELLVRDAGAELRPGRFCEAVDEHAAACGTSFGVEVLAGDGDDTVDTRAAPRTPAALSGGPGADRLLAGTASGTVLAGDAGLDVLEGGTAVDYSTETAPVRVDLTAGVATTAAGVERLGDAVRDATGGRGADRLIGDEQANRLHGGSGEDDLSGRGGADTLVGGTGRDVLRGGDGDDALGYSGYPEPADPSPDRFDCGAGTDRAEPAGAPYVLEASCEGLTAGRLPELRLRGGREPSLAIPRDLATPPWRMSATVRLDGAHRVERRLRFAVPRSAGELPRGARRLLLGSRRIIAARRRGPAVVDVRLHAVAEVRGERDYHYRGRLRIRLPGLP